MILFAIPVIDQLETVMRHVLTFFHTSFGLPWAWAIIATTVVVRIILVPLTIRQIHSMQALQVHAPEMKRIQQKYKHDRQKQNEELMKFYRENKINPAASCLPMLLQLPVFIALYYTLKHFQFTGDVSYLGFIHDISAPTTAAWGGYVLLVVYVVSQMVSGLYMAPTAQKSQRAIFMIMPLVFVFVIARFPAGLVLYWVTTNLWTVGQGLITRRLVQRTPAPAPERRSSRTPPKPEAEADGDGSAPAEPSPEPSQSGSGGGRPRQVRRKKKKSSGRR